ncbi:MAG TPA: DUF2848 family protein [Symbiobacteriaceae bacterium]|nr:DUF2848 family protein [Symbiobacteriaceae bacterium]
MTFRLQSSGVALPVQVKHVYVAGFTGRNQKAVMEHIHELEAHGIPAPPYAPILYFATLDKFAQSDVMQVVGGTTSGEVEPVLVIGDDGEIYVGVGSDHTDREAEKAGIPVAKQLCSKMVSEEVWPYREVRDRWDDLVIRSWTGSSGPETLYQEGPLRSLLPPDEILELVRRTTGEVRNCVVFLGTVSLLGGQFHFSQYFRAELFDPATGRALQVSYRVQRIDTPVTQP